MRRRGLESLLPRAPLRFGGTVSSGGRRPGRDATGPTRRDTDVSSLRFIDLGLHGSSATAGIRGWRDSDYPEIGARHDTATLKSKGGIEGA